MPYPFRLLRLRHSWRYSLHLLCFNHILCRQTCQSFVKRCFKICFKKESGFFKPLQKCVFTPIQEVAFTVNLISFQILIDFPAGNISSERIPFFSFCAYELSENVVAQSCSCDKGFVQMLNCIGEASRE